MFSSAPSCRVIIIFALCKCLLAFSTIEQKPILSVAKVDAPTSVATSPEAAPTGCSEGLPGLSGGWADAKQSLRYPDRCVVTIPGLDRHLSTLQEYFCGADAPSDLDLRMRVRCGGEESVVYADCMDIYSAVMEPQSYKDATSNESNNNPCVLSLVELARGVASLADGPLEGTCTDVHMRVVCASSYQAIDPMFHTDKCPLRGYVTLTGPGTEYMDETCLPWEYAALRSFGVDGLSSVSGKGKARRLKMAEELEFIVMKGDCYDAPLPDGITQSVTSKLWNRSSACVHRSPQGGEGKGRRRVILSLDLADGKDNQEWYEISRKREWRSGMTQRKSRLVS